MRHCAPSSSSEAPSDDAVRPILLRSSWLASLALCVVALGVAAITPAGFAAGDVVEPETDAEEIAESDDLPPLDEAIEGYDVVNNSADGREPTLFTIYRKEDSVLALIPEELLNTPWLLGASNASGPFGAGEQIGSTALEWRRRGDTLDVYEPELRYTSTTKPTLAPGIRRAYTDRYITSAPILSESDDGGVLIDLTQFVTANASTLVGYFGLIDSSAAMVEKIKAFPQNVELAISAPLQLPASDWFFGSSPDGLLQTLHFSFSGLPEDTAFEKRAADPRVGYWVHANMDIGQRRPLESDMVRTIERWDLRKSDPDASRSPPARPIIFYIENTVPIAYRVHVRRGVEVWNEAFRAVGIENAIEVRQQTDQQYTDIDPEDIRYNFVRWVPTGFGYAIALHRTDPRTGEILDADIVIDDGWLNYWVDEYPLLTQEAVAERYALMARQQPNLAPVVDELATRARAKGLLAPDRAQRRTFDTSVPEHRAIEAAWRDAARRSAPGVLTARRAEAERCTYARRLGHHMAMAHLSFMMTDAETHDAADDDGEEGPPMIDGAPEDLIAHNLVALVAHEVGHVLGLRHNFAASAWKPASAIDDYTDPAQETIAGSVMDYIGTFVADVDKPQGVYNMTRVGPYDRWAIAYGYMDGDEEELAAHLARSVEPGHRYMTDEDVYSVDPTPMRYDFGDDPVEGRQRQVRRVDYLRERLIERLAKDGSNWAKVRTAFNTLWFEEMSSLWDTTGWIGGTYLSRDFNTPGARPPMVNVEPERQRAVLRMLIDRLFSEPSLRFDRSLLNSLQIVRWYDSNFPSWAWSGAGDIDVLNQTNLAHYLVLSDLMFWCTPRLANQELRTDPSVDALTVPEMHRELTTAIWSEFAGDPGAGRRAWTNLDPKVGAVRRALQREHAGQLVDLAYRFPFMPASYASAQLVAVDQLREIKDRLTPWGGEAALDDYSRIHVREMLALIDATLEAQVTRAP